jgi:TRAP-type C4-dicarboxylate transport system permease small subunit
MAAQFYFPLSATFQDNGHIAVDILQPYLGNATRRASQAIIGFLSFGLFLAISIAFYGRAMEDWQSGAAHAGDYAWPSWLSMAIVPIGAGVLSLRCLLHGVGHLCALFGMRHTIPLPPIALSANISEAHVE